MVDLTINGTQIKGPVFKCLSYHPIPISRTVCYTLTRALNELFDEMPLKFFSLELHFKCTLLQIYHTVNLNCIVYARLKGCNLKINLPFF